MLAFAPLEIAEAAARVREGLMVVRDRATAALGVLAGPVPAGAALDVVAVLPPLYPEWLGDRGFLEAHGVRFPYVAGSMANGIATPSS